MPCDHVIGSHGSHFIRKSRWSTALGHMAAGVHFFRTTKVPVPHPGFVVVHAHCLDCGAKLSTASANASISEALSVAIDEAVGSGTAEPTASGLDQRSYMHWLSEHVVS